MPSFKARTRDCPMGMIESSATAPNFEALLNELNGARISGKSIRRWIESDDPIFRRNRFQATMTFPFIALLIADKPDIPMHMAIAATIDRGDPLIDSLSSFVGVKKSSVRFLRGKSPALIGKAWLDCPSELFVAIDLVAPEKLPVTSEEWRLFHEFWTGCRQFVGPSYLESTPDKRLRTVITRHMLSSLCSSGITKTAERLHRMLNGDFARLQGVQDYIRFVGDWCLHIAGNSGIHLNHFDDTESWWRDQLLTQYSAMELLRQSEQWHHEIALIAVDQSQDSADIEFPEWPGLPGLPLLVGHRWVTSLTNQLHLETEGSRLGHCVGSYLGPCLYGHSHIVSIRDLRGESLSTADISLTEDVLGTFSVSVLQHRAHSNSKPGRMCRDALTAVISTLKDPRLQPDLRAIIEFHASHRAEVQAMLETYSLGYSLADMNDVMSRVLRDPKRVMSWLEDRANCHSSEVAHCDAHGEDPDWDPWLDDEIDFEGTFEDVKADATEDGIEPN